ncbi:hypothetical protein DFH09DRAFT_1428013 [Mycena vulgaris]|nr:hypothetical protein DFH09DRAFT_1428013 [Mycena vulgaris]
MNCGGYLRLCVFEVRAMEGGTQHKQQASKVVKWRPINALIDSTAFAKYMQSTLRKAETASGYLRPELLMYTNVGEGKHTLSIPEIQTCASLCAALCRRTAADLLLWQLPLPMGWLCIDRLGVFSERTEDRTNERALAPTTRSAAKGKRHSSVPRTREETVAEELAPLEELRGRSSLPSPATTPLRTSGLGHGLGAAFVGLRGPISLSTFYQHPHASDLRNGTPSSSPLPPLTPSPVAQTAPATVITPARNSIPSIPRQIIARRKDMSTGPTFTGNGTSAAAAIDFIKDVRLGFRGETVKDADKPEEVGDRFQHRSPADIWFRASTFTTWAAFTRAFEERFAGMAPIVKPRAQLLAELAGMRITIENLATDHVLVGGEKISPMLEFRSRLREVVLDASAGSASEGVWSSHTALPMFVRVAVGAVPAEWDAMLAALAAVPQTAVDMEVEQHQRAVAFDAKSAAFEKSMSEMTRVMQNVRLAAASQQQAPRTTTKTSAPATNQNASAANQTATGGGGGGGGLWLRKDPIPVGTDEQRERLRKIMTDGNATQALSNPTGLALYATQIADWNRANGHIAPESVLEMNRAQRRRTCNATGKR